MNVELKVSQRYADGATQREEALCCPVDYDASLLKLLPQEIIDRDYGCGDPSRYVQSGDVVLDLGSGGGKICYMAAQLVGDKGRVIGVDMTDEMLALARGYQGQMAAKLGADRVTFLKGYIQDLALDVDALEQRLAAQPVKNNADLQALEDYKTQQKAQQPLIADDSVDLVVSNCVLNLVAEVDRRDMIAGIFRVLKSGGRVAISDIVSDEVVPEHLRADDKLWTGCISGAFQEQQFAQAFLDAGFILVNYDKWDEKPWQVVEGIEFRSVTLMAVKPSLQAQSDLGQAVIYKGPYQQVSDDEGGVYARGERIAVSDRTFKSITSGPLANDFIALNPSESKSPSCYCLPPGTLRPATESKGAAHSSAATDSPCC
ncbi:MAG: methyltransferase [SAR86 cluster bacterium]|uniref:Arsenite methyltransferase n=1 Tax=SAR86 cluster bacterium TaxID=2030880 RepID=A0A2A4MS54_9GAMM|nr:MAG: methyltransferase [SAR86 cluster bacterium]